MNSEVSPCPPPGGDSLVLILCALAVQLTYGLLSHRDILLPLPSHLPVGTLGLHIGI